MQKLAVLVVAWMVVALPAAAAPPSLSKGHWSLGFEADRDVNINVGYGLADMTRLIINGGLFSPGDLDDREITTSYSVGVAVHRYLQSASTERFAVFLGGGVAYLAPGETVDVVTLPNIGDVEVHTDPGDVIDMTARFGAEVFPWEPLSVSGYVGLAFDVHTEGEVGIDEAAGVQGSVDARNDLSTFSSAIVVTFYWGSGS